MILQDKIKTPTPKLICLQNECLLCVQEFEPCDHGTYERKVQDLPILGKTTYLSVNAYEFQCDNLDCDATTFVENVNGFLSYYNRMTERCADFICTLAMETSCEGAARIYRAMNLQTSGDSIIRLLIK